MSDRNACGEIHPAELTLQEEIAAVMRHAACERPLTQPGIELAEAHPALRDYWLDRATLVLGIVARRLYEITASQRAAAGFWLIRVCFGGGLITIVHLLLSWPGEHPELFG